MRGLLFLAVCVLGQLNEAPLYSFSAKFNATSPMTYAISSFYTSDVPVTCNLYSSTLPYATFSYNFPTAGVRFINAINTYYVHVTSNANYNISDLCQNTTVWPLERSSASPVSDANQYGFYFEANTNYTIFVFAYSSSTDTIIAELWDTKYNGQLILNSSTSNYTWLPMYTSSGSCTQQSSSYEAYFSTQIVTVNTSGYYNTYAAFAQNYALPYNVQTPQYPRFAVLRGSYSNVDVSTATCGSNFTAGDQGDNSFSALFLVWLDANQPYTFVVSADDLGDPVWQGHYGITLTPAMFQPFSKVTTWQKPSRSSCLPTQTCIDDSAKTPLPYAVAYFTVASDSPFFLWATQPTDYSYFLYSEHNSGITSPLTCGTLRQTCFYGDDDGIPGGMIFPNSGSNTDFTIVVTSYGSTPYPDGNFTLIVMSGPLQGGSVSSKAPTQASSAPSATPTSPTSPAPTTVGTTKTPTSAAPTTVGTTLKPTPRNSNTPTASINAVALSQPCLITLAACFGFGLVNLL